MGRSPLIVTTAALLVLLGCGPEPTLPRAEEPGPAETDYQKQADAAQWSWEPKQANLLFCVRRDLRDYQVEIVCPKQTFPPAGEPLTVRLTDDGKEVYSFKAHDGTVFTRRGDVLYIARFSPIATGCSVVAHDFKAKKELWKAELKGIGPVDHSKYRNEVTVTTTAADDAILVTGKEAAGRYIEYLDARSGKTVGHKVFK
jgi:hypothetical protein